MKKIIVTLLFTVMIITMFCGCGKKSNAGLFQNDELVMTWQELLDQGVISVKNGELTSGFYENEGAIGNTSKDTLQGKLVIEEGVTKIAYSGFRYCEGLEQIVLPQSLKEIDNYAFQCCYMLKELNIPKNLKTLGHFCIENCVNLQTITVEKGNKNYIVVDGVLFSKNKKTLVQYPVGCTNTEYEVPKKVSRIETGAFCLCTNLNSISIPKDVKEIGDSAFWGCTGLETIQYAGSETKWEKISKGTEWMEYSDAEIQCQ